MQLSKRNVLHDPLTQIKSISTDHVTFKHLVFPFLIKAFALLAEGTLNPGPEQCKTANKKKFTPRSHKFNPHSHEKV